MSADLLALLDQLDEARAKATPGEWSSQENRVYARGYRVATVVPGGEPGAPEADTALIVAAVNHLPTLIAAVRAGLAEHQPAGPCSCEGRRWTKDENWSPEDLRSWRGERREGLGLIPCGFCNHGGWNTEQYEPVDPFCEVCDLPWPCPTVTAITAALTPEPVQP